MTTKRPVHERLVACLDCASEVDTEHVEGAMNVWVKHSSTCPVWSHHPARELAFSMVGVPPVVEDDDTDDEAPA